MKYLKKFLSATTYEEYVSGDYDKPNVSLIDETGDVEYNDAELPSLLDDMLAPVPSQAFHFQLIVVRHGLIPATLIILKK